MAEVPISPVVGKRPELIIESAAINSEPVELDGTPTSPDQMKARHASTRRTSTQVNSEGSAISPTAGEGLSEEDRAVRCLLLPCLN